MKIQLTSLGVLKQASFEMGDLTIICGKNNTGKTYATYALYGFLETWRDVLNVPIGSKIIPELLQNGAVTINLGKYYKEATKILHKICEAYTQRLPKIFAANSDYFKDSKFQIDLEFEYPGKTPFERIIRAANKTELFSISKGLEEDALIISLLVEKDRGRVSSRFVIEEMINVAILDILFERYFPRPFIASAERTGAAIFRKELNFARNHLLKEISKNENDIDPIALLFKGYQNYALPVERNVEFTRTLENIAKEKSFIAEEYPEVLNEFTSIIGGEYNVTRDDQLYFIPTGSRMKLTMDESSSAVRSLLDVGFYLRHVAKPNDLLMIDEPELNLHPENQRLLARMLARIINLGVKVFITTHSDYIVKEINTLVMLKKDDPYLEAVAQEEGYEKEELIDANQIKVFIAEEALIKPDGYQRRIRCPTLVEADIDPDMGIDAHSFDETINAMNFVQEKIVWGGGE